MCIGLRLEREYEGSHRTVTGLTNGNDYNFVIRAVNSSGAGKASSSDTQRPGVPKAPASVSAQMSNDVVELEWSEPDHHGIGIDSYETTVTQLSGRVLTERGIMLTQLTARASSIITSSTSYTLTGRTGSADRISVRAINTYGSGLAAVTSIGSIAVDDDGWLGPAPHVQHFGAPADPTPERCAATAPTGLNWSGVPSGGWSVSWAS